MNLAQLYSFRGILTRTALSSDTSCKLQGFPNLLSSLIVHWKDSQNSLKNVIVMPVVYCEEKMQIKNQPKKDAKSIGDVSVDCEVMVSIMKTSLCPSSYNVPANIQSIVNQKSPSKPLLSTIFTGAQSHTIYIPELWSVFPPRELIVVVITSSEGWIG